MIRSLTFSCSVCSSNFTIGTERFEHFSIEPVICSCGNIFSVPVQKLFWIVTKLQKIWFNLPSQGIAIDKPATQLKRQFLPLKVKTIPFRIKHRPTQYYLMFDEDDNPYFEAVVNLVLDEVPPLQVALLEYQHGSEQGWEALPELAYWTRRINQEIAELGSNRVVEICFYAPSAIHRKR